MGVKVSETTAEIRMVALSVMANSRNRRPTTSPMNSSGISTAINETVSDRMVKPICSAPLRAACIAGSPASIQRAERSHQRQGNCDAGNYSSGEGPEEQEDHHDHQRDGEH